MKPLTKQIKSLPMPSDLLSTYRRLAQLNGFALLKSDGLQHGQYDVVTALPYRCQQVNHVDELDDTLLQHEQFNHSSMGDFPFQGGVIGYLSYDFGALSHGIQLKNSGPYQHLPLACFNWYHWCIVVNHQRQEATLIYDTDDETLSIIKDIIGIWHQPPTEAKQVELSGFKPLWSKESYQQAFERIQSGLQEGRCYQVNLTQPYQLQSNANAWAVYEQISRKNPVPFGAFLNYANHQILSYSPECFITVDGETVTTRPIKGSIARSVNNDKVDKSLAQSLLNSDKDKAENVMIVDLLRNDLSKIAKKGSVDVKQLCQLHSYPKIHHLVSEITAIKQSNLSAFEVLLSAFPGGSITGAPKIEAMKMIAELELINRGAYCGSIFYQSDHGKLDSNIAIRTMISLDNTYWIHAGGGIVIDSKLEQEYEECLIKLAAIVNE